MSITLLKNKNIKLVLAGSYQWKMFNLPEMIKMHHLEERIILTGYVNDELLAPLYSLATLFCYISYDEGFGFPPLEAMASGVPVVVANTGSLPEICAEAGNYVDPHDPGAVAKSIDRLLENEVLYSGKKAAGILRSKHFSWENSARDLMASLMKTCVNHDLIS